MNQDGRLTLRDNDVRPGTKRIGLIALCAAYFAIILDAGALNLAVPTIRHDLHASVTEIQWALSGYTLTLAALLLSAGAAGDRFGHRRMLTIGITIFGLASIGCAAAPNVIMLIVARLIQGAGAGTLLPATLALMPHLYPPGRDRQRATLIWVGTGGFAMAVAPLFGGALVATVGWRTVFLVNIPIAIITLALSRIGLPANTRAPVRLDLTAQILGALIMAALATAAIASGPSGWNSLPVGVSVLVAILLGLVLVVRRSRSQVATEKVGHGVRTAVASAGIMGFSFYGVLYFLSLHLQEQRDWSPLHTGIALLPLTVASTIGPFIYGPLNRRWIASVVLLGGFTSVLFGTVTLLAAGSSAPFWTEVVAMLLVGGASTLCFSALTSILVDTAPTKHMGKLSGWQNTSRQAGAMLATALVGSLIIGAPASHEIQATALLIVVAAAGVGVAFAETRARRSTPGKTTTATARTG